MSIQFQAKYLLEDFDELESLKSMLLSLGASQDSATMLVAAVAKGQLGPSTAVDIVKSTAGIKEDGGSATGGGTTTGATFTPGTGMQYTTKKRVKEDAPKLAAGKADISTYTNDGFTKAKRGKGTVKGIEVKDLWEEEVLEEARGYSQFKKETATRTKAQQMHEAAKAINKKLDEINKLLEYTDQMRMELAEGEEQLEYKHNTKALFEKMNRKVVEAYTKLKKVK